MTISEFSQENALHFTQPYHALSKKAVEIMHKSKDPLHDENHVYRLLDYLDKFLEDQPQALVNRVRLQELVVAVAWHDTWKSQRPSEKVITTIYNWLWDGMGSARLFKKAAEHYSLPEDAVKRISYTIRKHNSTQLFPRRTLEAKILKDLDELEKWSLKRLVYLEEEYLKKKQIPTVLIRLFQVYAKIFMRETKDPSYFFEWTYQEYLKRKDKVHRKMKELFTTHLTSLET